MHLRAFVGLISELFPKNLYFLFFIHGVGACAMYTAQLILLETFQKSILDSD